MKLRITAQNRWILTLQNNRPILKGKFEIKDFSEGYAILELASKVINKMDHHPHSVTIGPDYIEFILMTHDENGVSDKDQKLAKEIDKIILV